MKNKNVFVSYTITVFVFLFSGTVISYPIYNPSTSVVTYITVNAVLILYACLVSRYFSKKSFCGHKAAEKFFAVLLLLLSAIPMSAYAAGYVRTLGCLSNYYASAFCRIFAGAAVIGCGIYAASRKRLSVTGFARLVFPIFVIWTVAGYFAFFSTENAIPVPSPFENVMNTDLEKLVKDICYICIDITFMAVALTDNESTETRKTVPASFLCGTLAYSLVSGLNLIKNLMLFGGNLSFSLDNPNLTAIRMIPMFDLPEISVAVDTFSCVTKIAMYSCMILFVLKNSFREKYKTERACPLLFLYSGAACAALFCTEIKNPVSEWISIVCMTVSALICFVVYRKDEKT